MPAGGDDRNPDVTKPVFAFVMARFARYEMVFDIIITLPASFE